MAPAELGSRSNPHTVEPEEDMGFGQWCKCSVCGREEETSERRSFSASGPGAPLVCNGCTFDRVMAKKGVKTG